MKPLLLLLLRLVRVTPDSTQFWEYQEVPVLVSCEDLGPDWTVWRFTKSGDLSQCRSGWGTRTQTSACRFKTLKSPDSGLYWCESKTGDPSPGVNITVTGGPVILEIPVQVRPEQDVVLTCRSKSGLQDQTVDFFRNEVLLKSGPDPQTTLRFDKDHQGAYSCRAAGHRSPPVQLSLRGDSRVPVLVLSPDWAQVFEYSSIVFSCEPWTEGWTVLRHRPGSRAGSRCGSGWGFLGSGGVCFLNTTKTPDTALYWCGRDQRRSNSVQLQVRDRGVVLQMPALPVSLGDPVLLTCRHQTDSALSARFYRNGHILSEQPSGHMILQEVALSDEGQYFCEINEERSESSRLRVRPVAPSVAERGGAASLPLLRYLVVFAPYVVSTALSISIYRHQGGQSSGGCSSGGPTNPRRRRRGQRHIEPDYEDVTPDVTTEYEF